MHTWLTPNNLAWIPAILYFVAGIPQIIKNHKAESVHGLSYRMIFFLLIGSSMRLLYNYYLALPLPYQIMRPLTLLVSLILVYQGYIYAPNSYIRRNVRILYTLYAALFMGMSVWGVLYTSSVGHIAGWVSVVTLSIYQTPQVVKNYRLGSVEGLSFSFVTLTFIANVFEMSIAYAFGLQTQSIFNGLRGVIYYCIFCYQFMVFGKTRRKGRA